MNAPTKPSQEGRVAVVTGAARGIGQAICAGLAERGAMAVVGVDVLDLGETASRVTEAGARWLGLEVDLRSPECGREVAERVTAEFGRCDILVNNAAVDDAIDWDSLDGDRWRNVMTVNLEAPFHLCKALVPLMRENAWGRIVNVASGSVMAPIPQHVAYRASKMGLIGFTRALAVELGDDGIVVNVMSPGVTRTAMVQAGLASTALEAAAQNRAIRRVAEPDDLVGTVLFLTSEDAAFVTGQTILANGGACFV